MILRILRSAKLFFFNETNSRVDIIKKSSNFKEFKVKSKLNNRRYFIECVDVRSIGSFWVVRLFFALLRILVSKHHATFCIISPHSLTLATFAGQLMFNRLELLSFFIAVLSIPRHFTRRCRVLLFEGKGETSTEN